MGLIKGGFQRLLQTALYIILFLASGVILGFYSYFLAVLSDRNQPIPTWVKAVEGISGAACLYLIFASILTCCLGGIAFLAFIAIVLDICFAAAMIAVAVLTRDGADTCTGIVQTPLGNGPASATNGFGNGGFGLSGNDNTTYSVHLGLACKYNSACFACAVICAILFLCTAAMQLLLVRHHKKEKRLGPSPGNNYTSGYGKKRFGFGRNKNRDSAKAAEAGAFSSPTTNNRVSGETGYTGTTVGGPGYDAYHKDETAAYPARGAHSGYYTAPTGTATSNPYGYNNTTTWNQPATNY